METRGWLAIVAGAAFIAFAAHPVLAWQGSAGAGVRHRGAVVLAGDNAPGPDADWVEVPSDNGQPEAGGDSGAQPAEQGPAADSNNPAVTIVEFGDYECPYCRGEEPTLNQLRRKYGGEVRIVFRDFPLKIHTGAMEAAIAARCAGDQGAFQQYHDALYSGRYGFSTRQLEAVAQALGLDPGTFNSCLQGQRYKDEVTQEIADARRLGVHVTPTFLINGQMLAGEQPLSAFESVIDAQLRADAP